MGIGGYSDYLTVLRNLSGVTDVARNLDLSSTALALGLGGQVAAGLQLCGYGVAVGAILLSLRRDREVGFIVTVGASLLLSPLIWDHYLAMLVLPAAMFADRGRPAAIALPLLSWLPSELLPFVALLPPSCPSGRRTVTLLTWGLRMAPGARRQVSTWATRRSRPPEPSTERLAPGGEPVRPPI